MPRAINPPEVREQVRIAYLSNGRNLSAAAQLCGIPIDRCEKWKERGKWDVTVSELACRNVSETASKHVAAMSELGEETKINFAKASARVAKHVSEEHPEKLMQPKRAQGARHWSAIASTVHGWEKSGANDSNSLNINVLSGRGGKVLVGITSDNEGNAKSPTVEAEQVTPNLENP